MKNNKSIINITMIKLRKFLYDEEYRQKETARKKQELYDYDYKKFLEKVNPKTKREDNRIIYVSSANKYYKWIKHNPIKFVERYVGIKLKWYQKIILLFIHYKDKRKQNKIDRIINRYRY